MSNFVTKEDFMKQNIGKKKLLFLVILIIIVLIGFSANQVFASSDIDVTDRFEDEKLKNSILEMAREVSGDKAKNRITMADIEAITSDSLPSGKQLDLSDKGIKNLTGLELFSDTGLEWIYLDWNEIQDISILKELKSLTKISLNHNRISDISAIGELTQLKNLSLSYNQITDIKPIAQLKELAYLAINDNQLSDISYINLPKLKEISVAGNQLQSIHSLFSCKQLQQIEASRNQITNLEGILNQSSLEKLNLNYNLLTSLKGIENLTNLKVLSCSNNQLQNIEDLTIQTLESVNLNVNQIRDASIFNQLPNIKLLYLDRNQIFDFSKLSNLKEMDKYTIYNQIDSVEIKQKLEKEYAQIGMPDLFTQLLTKGSNVYQENRKVEVIGSTNYIISGDFTNITFPKKDLEKGVTIVVSDNYNTILSYSIETDKTAPVIIGIENEMNYKEPVFPTSEDTDVAEVVLIKNGEKIPYSLGNEIKEEGEYILKVSDRAGNTTTIMFYIEYYMEDEIKGYIIKDGCILNIQPKTDYQTFVANLNPNIEYQIYRNGILLSNSSKIATGDILIAGGKERYSLVVVGDVNGDGQANIKDLVQVRKCIIDNKNLNGIFLKAADINLDNLVNIKDVVKLRKLIL